MSTYYLRPDKNRANIVENLKAFIDKLDPTKDWEISVEREVKERTTRQNKALFGHAYPILREQCGFDVGVMHDQFCMKFFGSVTIQGPFGKKQAPRRTTTTDESGKRDVIEWDQFCDFYDMVGRYASDAGVFIPEPDPFWRERERKAA